MPLQQTVAGLNVSFLEVFQELRKYGCLTYVLGGEVRDSILKALKKISLFCELNESMHNEITDQGMEATMKSL